MATVNKDFKIKSGLVVEGTTATVNGYDILTKKAADQSYIVDLIGGQATPDNTADTVVKRNDGGSFSAQDITLDGTLYGTHISNNSTVTITSQSNDIVLDADGWVYAGNANSRNIVATRGRVDDLIGDNTVDTTPGNTVTDRIQSAANDAGYTAEFNAKQYADGITSQALANAESYADLKAAQAVSNAESYADTVAGQAYSNASSYADSVASTLAGQAYANAASYTDSAAASWAGQAYANATSYTDSAVAGLVDSAPELLNTLNELAAAIADNPNYATDIANLISTKQDTLIAGTAIDISSNTISVVPTDLVSGGAGYTPDYVVNTVVDSNGKIAIADQHLTTRMSGNGIHGEKVSGLYYFAIDRNSTDTWYDASGSAANAQSAAESFASTVAGQAYANATSYVDNAINGLPNALITSVSTDFTVTGGELQLTDSNLVTLDGTQTLTNKELVNPLINGEIRLEDSNGTFEALISLSSNELVLDTDSRNIILSPEGGNVYVQNSNTSDNIVVTQGTLNNAINGADITPNSVSINNYRKEEATQQYVGTASTVDVHSIGYPYESAKYLVRVVGWDGGLKHSQITEVLMTVDGNDNIAITEYGNVHTSTNPLATFSARLDQTGSTRYVLTATTAVNGCEIIAAATMLSWAD